MESMEEQGPLRHRKRISWLAAPVCGLLLVMSGQLGLSSNRQSAPAPRQQAQRPQNFRQPMQRPQQIYRQPTQRPQQTYRQQAPRQQPAYPSASRGMGTAGSGARGATRQTPGMAPRANQAPGNRPGANINSGQRNTMQPRTTSQPRMGQNPSTSTRQPMANSATRSNGAGANGAGGRQGSASTRTQNNPSVSGNQHTGNQHTQQAGNGIQRPQGKPTVSRTAGGGTRQSYADGTRIDKTNGGKTTHYSNPRSGVEASFDRSGRPSQISKVGQGSRTVIQRGAGGQRRVETTRTVKGGVERVVNYGGNRGYVQRPMAGRPGYVQRTVMMGGRSYGAVYRSYAYHGVFLCSPIPAVVFAPAYYGWLLTPWAAPVYYTPAYWGWAGQPWYGYYGVAFAPYPVYAAPDQWLTDYIIAANLQQAYADQQAAAGDDNSASAPQPITDEEKSYIDQDLKDELAREQQAAPSYASTRGDETANPPAPTATEVPEALKNRIFQVYAAPVEAKLKTGTTCNLAEGDMLLRKGNAPNADNTVDVVVKHSHADASHPDLCMPQAEAGVQLADLQEMYNHQQELLAQGEQQQAKLMGKKHGTPKGPKPEPTEVAAGKVDPDGEAVAELKQQMKDADQTEQEVTVASAGGN